MDRQTIYSGQLPRTVDLLHAEQFALVALAKLAETALGTPTLVDGFTCTPTTPASLNVLLTPGVIMQIENLEATTWSQLAADTHSILKQGILLDADALAITPPGTVGYSQVYLIEAQYQDSDTGSTVLPYYNAANPAAPFSGPGNAGTAQNTIRKGIVAVQIKAGIAAATGTQVAPTPDAGWTALFLVTVANGQTTITSGNIATYPGAPFLATNGKLPQIPTGVQNSDWVGFDDIGAANAYVIKPAPGVSAYKKYQKFRVKITHTNTQMVCTLAIQDVNGNSLGTKQIILPGGLLPAPGQIGAGMIAELVYDGTAFELTSAPYAQARSLTANQNWYVNTTTGSDSYDGTSATVINASTGPFKTINRGYVEAAKYNMNGFNQFIRVADGGYNESILPPGCNGAGRIYLIGNQATPGNVNIHAPVDGSGNVRSPLLFETPGSYSVDGVRLAVDAGSIGPDSGVGLWCAGVASMIIGAVQFGPCPGGHIGGYNSLVSLSGPVTIEASATAPYHINAGPFFFLDANPLAWPNYTILGAVTFSTAFVYTDGGNVALKFGTLTGAGSVTGSRYQAVTNGVINSFGGGASYYPGSSSGTTASGGQYV